MIPAGTDPESFPDRSPAEARRELGFPDRPTVGFIGRLAAYKGIDTLLDAAPALWEQRPDTTVLVAGSPSGWDGYRDPAIAAVAGDRLVVREGFASDQRALLLAACEVVVHPSREESFGMVAVESWAARRPIVVADIPAVRSVVEPGHAGELIAPGDAAALARVLVELLGDPERCRRLGAAGRAAVEESYSWDRVGAAWEALVTGLVARNTVGDR
ncbi:glycosyltransferase family 4 protein [Aquihabitans daechungensis]|uniref:glycosyltransferase family 4 protein n=1 Tax=Aquihabitans daechungensis TaxID=1052257 RepID=UPI003BA2DA43